MLYSLNFMKNREHRRLLFYAEDREKAEDVRIAYARNTETPPESITIEEHPRGASVLGRNPRYWPAREPQKGCV